MNRRFAVLGSVALTLSPVAAWAGKNPFATHKLVLQLSDATPAKQKEVLNNANAVLKAYPDTVSIIVVAFGPGVSLLFADSPLRVRVNSLAAQGVQFDVCMNTINTITRKTGKTPLLNPIAKKVPFGVVRIMQLVKRGYILVRP